MINEGRQCCGNKWILKSQWFNFKKDFFFSCLFEVLWYLGSFPGQPASMRWLSDMMYSHQMALSLEYHGTHDFLVGNYWSGSPHRSLSLPQLESDTSHTHILRFHWLELVLGFHPMQRVETLPLLRKGRKNQIWMSTSNLYFLSWIVSHFCRYRKFLEVLNMVTHFAHLQDGPVLCDFSPNSCDHRTPPSWSYLPQDCSMEDILIRTEKISFFFF